MEETSDENKMKEPIFLHNPCNYFQECIRAILKCLGLESEPQGSSSNVKSDEMSGQGSSSSAEQPADPPSSMPDPPTDPSAAAMARIGRAPPSPPISGGRGPQTNSSSS